MSVQTTTNVGEMVNDWNRERSRFFPLGCGEEFINLSIDTKKRRLTNTYHEEATPKVGITHQQFG
ncbi:hypothetical protein LMG29542_05821 [Paraburkholderia humisilvae]|uniref:Uncharacterized protein n=1 Tax=Paraburkholderia humisilvae TaxID=627669 RepID=A0A6J5ESX0_9BURK|nr:hypothetical protein LMG29542_05821 [Paraburkholderia humisilvae]